jgi:GMP synthase (glutamine-hydrolysing)
VTDVATVPWPLLFGGRMLIVIQNDPEVPLGNYAACLASLPVDYAVVNAAAGEPLPAAVDGTALLVLGGAMGVGDVAGFPFLLGVKELIRQCLQQGIPYLGLCLGGQLLAEVAGGRVVSNRWEELGTLPVQLTSEGERSPLFAGVPATFDTFQWHHDSFDLPPGAQLLASSAACPNQAFAVGSRAFGLQFHPEMLSGVIADWCRWAPQTTEAAEDILVAFDAVEVGYRAISWQILRNFLGLAGLVAPKNQA